MTKFRLFLLYSFPVALFCSYFPIIPLFSTASTNYELSLPLIWLFLFSVLSLKDFFSHIADLFKAFRKNKAFKTALPLLSYLFPIYLLASTPWSLNPLRALFTAGIVCCLIITAVSIAERLKAQIDGAKLLKIFLISSIVFCALCWIQSLLDVLGVGREITFLCLGCTSRMFGFPHPSGLAIEPQFMGNLLLAPTLPSLYLWHKSLHDIKSPKSQAKKQGNTEKYITARIKSRNYLALSFFFSSTLFLTFSRGAIYSFVVAFIALFVFELVKLKNKTFWKTLPLLFVSFVFTLFVQGLFSAASYTDSTFLSGIEKSISQLSLGKIELASNSSDETSEASLEAPDGVTSEIIIESSETSFTPVFSGYVEESTSVRMKLNQFALELAPRSLLFGFGLGSAGEIMFREKKTAVPAEIVQNEYLSLLLETGLVGLLLALLSFVALIVRLKSYLKAPEFYLLLSLILSYLFSLLFFSGLPNALHIYLFPVFLSVSLRPTSGRSLPAPL